jgi:hypothetical protein
VEAGEGIKEGGGEIWLTCETKRPCGRAVDIASLLALYMGNRPESSATTGTMRPTVTTGGDDEDGVLRAGNDRRCEWRGQRGCKKPLS